MFQRGFLALDEHGDLLDSEIKVRWEFALKGLRGILDNDYDTKTFHQEFHMLNRNFNEVEIMAAENKDFQQGKLGASVR